MTTKKETYIQTSDGKTRVEWWQKEDFQGRSNELIADYGRVREVSIIPVPDDCILCDFCNAEIKEFPVPVLWGTHAACRKCYENMQEKHI